MFIHAFMGGMFSPYQYKNPVNQRTFVKTVLACVFTPAHKANYTVSFPSSDPDGSGSALLRLIRELTRDFSLGFLSNLQKVSGVYASRGYFSNTFTRLAQSLRKAAFKGPLQAH